MNFKKSVQIFRGTLFLYQNYYTFVTLYYGVLISDSKINNE